MLKKIRVHFDRLAEQIRAQDEKLAEVVRCQTKKNAVSYIINLAGRSRKIHQIPCKENCREEVGTIRTGGVSPEKTESFVLQNPGENLLLFQSGERGEICSEPVKFIIHHQGRVLPQP